MPCPSRLLLSAVIIAVSAGCTTTAPDAASPRVFTLYEQQLSFVYADAVITIAVPPVNTPFTAHGDTFYVNNQLLDGDPRAVAETKSVGVVRRACVRVESRALKEDPKDPFRDQQRESLCTMTFVLEGRGQLVAEGAMDENAFEQGKPSTMAVIGGTGEFIGAKGEVTMAVLILPNSLLKTEFRLLP